MMSLANNPLTLVTDPALPWSLPYVGLPALGVVALVLVLLTVATYAGAPRATGSRIALLVLLRLAALLLAFLALLRPSLAFRDELHVPSTLLIAGDGSESMTVQDEIDGQSRWAALVRALEKSRPVLQRLRDEDNVNVVLYRFAGEVGDLDPQGKADGKRTDFGELLHDLFERHRAERRLRGLVILSDGADNGSRYQPLPLAAQWRSLPCPVTTVAFGKPTTSDKQSDIVLASINPDPSPVPVKGEVTVRGTVDAPGFENATVRVSVLFDDKEVANQDLALPLTTGNEVKVKCNAPDTPGEIKVTLRVEPLPGELSVANNEISTYLTVTKEGVSVLLVDKDRFPEPQLLCDALRQDRRVRLYTAWLRGGPGAGAGGADLFQFARQHYDVIILGDVPADQLRAADPGALAAIYRLVSEKGTGLLMMGGYRSFGLSWRGTEVEKLLPVKLDRPADPGGLSEQIHGPVRMVPTEAGLRHYVLRLADRPEENAAVWAKLPLLNEATRLGTPKDGAVVLAAVGDAQTGQPLLVMQTYGGGRTLAFGGDTTYRWVTDELGEQAHARFWKQLVLWLAHQEDVEGSVWVKPDTRRLAAGSKLGFSVGVRGKGGVDLKDGQFEAQVVGPKDVKTPVPTAREKDGDRGSFWKTDAPGEYRLVVTGKAKDADGAEVSGEATARFLVYQDDAEMARRAADHDFLKKLASTGGGKFLRPEELPGFLEDLRNQPLPDDRPKTTSWPEWKSNRLSWFLVVYFLLFVKLLSLEWFLRRRWGLV
jgi:uncharacterized membrane protein